MQTIKLGRTGLKVSRLCLGTMTFGWSADEKESFAIMDAAIEAEEIPPGYVDSIRQYFDKLEDGAAPAPAVPAKP